MRALRVVWLGLLAAAVGLAVWAAGGQREFDLVLPRLDSNRPRPQGGFYVGATSEPAHLNPFTSSDPVALRLILRYTHDTLLDRDPATGGLIPAVAAAMNLEPGGRSLVVDLRDDVRFEDGELLTVDDLEFVFRAAKAPGALLGSVREVFDLLTRFERTGPRSFRLWAAMQHFKLRGTVGIGYPILQAKYWRRAVHDLAAAHGVPRPDEGTPEYAALLARVTLPGPGTGAYALARDRRTGQVAWRRNVDLWLVQNPASWRRRAQPECFNLMGFHLRFLTDPAASLAELRAGRLDWYSGDDAETLFRADLALQERMRLLVYQHPRLGHHMVAWNLRRKPFDDARVRRALSMLFDRRAIVDKLLGGHGQPAAAWFRPGEPEYPADVAPMPFDPEAARELLTAAGVVAAGKAPLEVKVVVANQLALQRRILEEAWPAFSRAGLRLAIERRDWSDVKERLENRDFDGIVLVWYHEPWIDPFANFHSSEAVAPGINYSGLQDAGVDGLLEAARVEPDATRRASIYGELARKLHDLQPVSLLVHPLTTLLVDKRFQSAEPGPLGVVADRFWVER